MPNHPAAPLVVDESERAALRALTRAGTTEQRMAMRARVVLAAADGMANERIAAQLGVHKMTVPLARSDEQQATVLAELHADESIDAARLRDPAKGTPPTCVSCSTFSAATCRAGWSPAALACRLIADSDRKTSGGPAHRAR